MYQQELLSTPNGQSSLCLSCVLQRSLCQQKVSMLSLMLCWMTAFDFRGKQMQFTVDLMAQLTAKTNNKASYNWALSTMLIQNCGGAAGKEPHGNKLCALLPNASQNQSDHGLRVII